MTTLGYPVACYILFCCRSPYLNGYDNYIVMLGVPQSVGCRSLYLNGYDNNVVIISLFIVCLVVEACI